MCDLLFWTYYCYLLQQQSTPAHDAQGHFTAPIKKKKAE